MSLLLLPLVSLLLTKAKIPDGSGGISVTPLILSFLLGGGSRFQFN